jgi:hypothetical protein
MGPRRKRGVDHTANAEDGAMSQIAVAVTSSVAVWRIGLFAGCPISRTYGST